MENDTERNDVNLCYKALGIEFGAPPEEVENAYQKLLAEIKKKQSAADPAMRTEAAADLELAHDLYEKIKSSITYSMRMKEANHAASTKEEVKKESALQFKICPSCKNSIGAAFKKCPYCRKPILTPFEMLIQKLFSGNSLVIMIILLLVIIAAVIFITNPDLLKRLTGGK